MRDMHYTAICTRPNGEIVRAACSSTELVVWTDRENLLRLEVTSWLLFLRIAATDTEVAVIGKRHIGGVPVLVRAAGSYADGGKLTVETLPWPARDPLLPPGDSGVQCVEVFRHRYGLPIAAWIYPDAQEYAIRPVEASGTGDRLVTTLPIPPTVRGTSQGWLGIDTNGPRWTDLNRDRIIAGARLTLPSELENGWWIGQGEVPPIGGVVAAHPTLGARTVATAPTQIPPQAVIGPDGRMEATYSFEAEDPRALFVHEDAWSAFPPASSSTPTPVPDLTAPVEDKTGELLEHLPTVPLDYTPPPPTATSPPSDPFAKWPRPLRPPSWLRRLIAALGGPK
jgi:hypothetical protein